MEDDKLYEIIEQFLSGAMTPEERDAFMQKMRGDTELLKKVEFERAMAYVSAKAERDSIHARLMDRYENQEKKSGSGLHGFTQEKDDKLIEFMNAAFIKNTDILSDDNDSVDIDWNELWEWVNKGNKGEKGDK